MIVTSVARTLAQYYLSLRISAAIAMPELATQEIPMPAPIVRQLPSRLRDGLDEREMIRDGEREWVVVREAINAPQSGFIWN